MVDREKMDDFIVVAIKGDGNYVDNIDIFLYHQDKDVVSNVRMEKVIQNNGKKIIFQDVEQSIDNDKHENKPMENEGYYGRQNFVNIIKDCTGNSDYIEIVKIYQKERSLKVVDVVIVKDQGEASVENILAFIKDIIVVDQAQEPEVNFEVVN